MHADQQKLSLFFYYTAALLSAKAWVYLGKSLPASTASLNSNTQSNVDVESHHGNIVALNSYLLFAPIPNI